MYRFIFVGLSAVIAFVSSAETVEDFVVRAEKAIAETIGQKKLPRRLPGGFRQAIDQLQKKNEFAKIDALIDRAWVIPMLSSQSERELKHARARALAAAGRKGEAMTIVNDMIAARNGVVDSILVGAEITSSGMRGFDAWYGFVEKHLDRADVYGIAGRDLLSLLGAYTTKADRGMNRARLEKAEAYYAKAGAPRKIARLEQYREMDRFPLSEEELRIPKDLRDFGFDPDRKVVHAKDFGWNPTNATACLTAAVNSDASTVIVDDMGSPWYVYKVLLEPKTASNKQIVFRKGVKIHSVPLSPIKDVKVPFSYRDSHLFALGTAREAVSNVVFIGEGKAGDVYLGQFPDRKSRFATGLRYGGCAFGGLGTRVLLRNLKLSNNLMDGFCMRGSYHYIVDCDLDDNLRQGLSVVQSHHCVYKNVKFCRTVGAEPHNGVDFEPPYEAYDTHYQYFLDCDFFDNAAGNVVFSTSTFAPVTVLFKRCRFEAGRYRNISILPRLSKYMDAFVKAPSSVVFDECRLDGYLDSPVLQMNGFIFDVLFRNCEMNEKARLDPTREPNRSPIFLSLDRGYYEGFYPNAGTVTFENVKANGWKGLPLVQVADTNGKLGVNSFRGVIDHNGKKVDMSRFSYLPPDRDWKECADLSLAGVTQESAPKDYESGFRFNYGHPWYQPEPAYLLVKRSGAERPSYLSVDPKFGGVGRVTKLDTSLGERRFVGYFEVRGGMPFKMKLMRGGVEIRDETGVLVVRKAKADYFGTTCLVQPVKKDAIWSFEALDDALEFKFYDPQSGLWAERPADLVTTKAGLPFAKREGAKRFEEGDVPVELPARYAEEVAKMAAARLSVAKAQVEAAVKDYEETSAALERMKQHADNDGVRREIEDVTRTVERLKLKADACRQALDESEEERRMAVVCGKWGTEFAPERVGGIGAKFSDGFFVYPSPQALRQLYVAVVSRMDTGKDDRR